MRDCGALRVRQNDGLVALRVEPEEIALDAAHDRRTLDRVIQQREAVTDRRGEPA